MESTNKYSTFNDDDVDRAACSHDDECPFKYRTSALVTDQQHYACTCAISKVAADWHRLMAAKRITLRGHRLAAPVFSC